MNRFEEHNRRKMEVPDLEDEWERAARKQAKSEQTAQATGEVA